MDITAQNNLQNDNITSNKMAPSSKTNAASDPAVNSQSNTRDISSLLGDINDTNTSSVPIDVDDKNNNMPLDADNIKKMQEPQGLTSVREGLSTIPYQSAESHSTQNVETIITETQNVEKPIPTEKPVVIEAVKPAETVNVPQEDKKDQQEKVETIAQTDVKNPVQVINTVDLRTGDKKTINVSPDADSTTKKADVEEQEFIDNIEKEKHELS